VCVSRVATTDALSLVVQTTGPIRWNTDRCRVSVDRRGRERASICTSTNGGRGDKEGERELLVVVSRLLVG
jgi:hypothetical protein